MRMDERRREERRENNGRAGDGGNVRRWGERNAVAVDRGKGEASSVFCRFLFT